MIPYVKGAEINKFDVITQEHYHLSDYKTSKEEKNAAIATLAGAILVDQHKDSINPDNLKEIHKKIARFLGQQTNKMTKIPLSIKLKKMIY